MTGAKPPLVFLGPTLAAAEALRLADDVHLRPPAKRGDIYRALACGYRTILLIDGEFHGSPSVWQREIVDAVAEGAIVHGASSMGALRAAELHTLGMIGHGRVFAWYRDGVIEADDEVALIYGPAQLGYPALSEPLVNLRATLAQEIGGLFSPAEAEALIDAVRALPFPERRRESLLNHGPAVVWPESRRAALAALLRERYVDQKRDDAVEALVALREHRNVPGPAADRSSSGPDFWIGHRLAAEGWLGATVETVAAQAGLATGEIESYRLRLAERFFLARWAEARGLNAESGGDRDTALAEAALGAMTAAGMTETEAVAGILCDWAEREGIVYRGLSGSALADWIRAVGPVFFGYVTWSFEVTLIQDLRRTGRLTAAVSDGWDGATLC